MAFKKLRVWPMMGKPKEPGGSLLELLLVRRKLFIFSVFREELYSTFCRED
jgi:hypothetical protein